MPFSLIVQCNYSSISALIQKHLKFVFLGYISDTTSSPVHIFLIRGRQKRRLGTSLYLITYI